MQVLEFLYESFMIIMIILIITILLMSGIIVRIATARIGDKVLEFAENTATLYKAKKNDKKVKFAGKTVAKKFDPFLIKLGISTVRLYLIEEGQEETTNLYSRISEDEKADMSMKDSTKREILRSGILDRFLAVFKRLGFSWESFATGLFMGMTAVLFLFQFGVI